MTGILEQPVSAVMEKDFAAVRKEDSIVKAIDIMAKNRLAFLTVVGEFDVVVGKISEHDLLKVFSIPMHSGISINNVSEELVKAGLGRSVGEIMTPQPITIEDSSPVSEAIRIITNNQVHTLPIVNKGGALVGVLSLLDIVNHSKEI